MSLVAKNESEKHVSNSVGRCSIRLVDDLLTQAISVRASDIHLEPLGTAARIRVRVDGKLKSFGTIAQGQYLSWLSRLKIIAGMDIAEKRLPQDGRLEMSELAVDLRISTLPTIFGEKVAIRILNKDQLFLSLDQLELTKNNFQLYESLYRSPNGMVLFTGPTGSGKTSSLYATLNELNKDNVNIVTIEEPVEYKLIGINQVAVNNKAGLTFAKGLRSIVRQDPNVIMVGEIRDEETASIALQAALTGHLLFSTLHTNTAIGAVARLLDMGIPKYLLSAALRGVVGQRLVRRICPKCVQEYDASDAEKELLDMTDCDSVVLKRGTGCSHCNYTGYYGRIALHEVLCVDNAFSQLINLGASEGELEQSAKSVGFQSIRVDGITKAIGGYTTVQELLQEGII